MNPLFFIRKTSTGFLLLNRNTAVLSVGDIPGHTTMNDTPVVQPFTCVFTCVCLLVSVYL